MYTQKPRIIKVGGAHLDDANYLAQLIGLIEALAAGGQRVVLVHGGGREIGELHAALDVPFRKELGLRVTSDRSMDLVAMVLCGLVNKRLVVHLNTAGRRALGLCGADLGVLDAELLNFEQLGWVGGPPRVDAEGLRQLLSSAEVLVVAPVCAGPRGALVNVNADPVAQAIAVALDAECLDFVTDVAAVRTPAGDARRLVPAEVEALIRATVVQGGMIPKLQASLAALDGGVDRVRIGNLSSLSAGTATEVCL